MNKYLRMSWTHNPLYVCAYPLCPDSRVSSTASASGLSVDIFRLLHSLHYRSCSVYCLRVLEDVIMVVLTSICGVIPIFLVFLRAFPEKYFCTMCWCLLLWGVHCLLRLVGSQWNRSVVLLIFLAKWYQSMLCLCWQLVVGYLGSSWLCHLET